MTDLAKQVRSHASKATRRKITAGGIETLLPEGVEEQARARVRLAVALDDQRPYDLQKTLDLEGPWNVTPQDLLDSNRRGIGSVLAIVRRLARPAIKVFANLEVPLYKQFKINLGIAEALNEILCKNSDLEAQLDDVTRRLETLEADRRRNNGEN